MSDSRRLMRNAGGEDSSETAAFQPSYSRRTRFFLPSLRLSARLSLLVFIGIHLVSFKLSTLNIRFFSPWCTQ